MLRCSPIQPCQRIFALEILIPDPPLHDPGPALRILRLEPPDVLRGDLILPAGFAIAM